MENALTGMRQTADDYNNPKPLFPSRLLIPGSNEFMSVQLLDNLEKSGTTNRDINAIRKRGVATIIWDYMTGLTGSWYLLCDPAETELVYYWREKINGQMKAAPDTTDDAIFMSRFRNSMGWIDWRGVYGSYGS
jgi:phage major head subunit gpT-like protein